MAEIAFYLTKTCLEERASLKLTLEGQHFIHVCIHSQQPPTGTKQETQ